MRGEIIHNSIVQPAFRFASFAGGGVGGGVNQVMLEEAAALKGQMCSVVFVSGTLVLLPFAVIMEGAQVGGARKRGCCRRRRACRWCR